MIQAVALGARAQRILNRYIHRVMNTVAEVLFPTNSTGMPDWQQTAVAQKLMAYLEELPPRQALLIRLLYIVTDLSPMLFFFAPRTFKNLSVEKRTHFIKKLTHSRFYSKRMLADALKANQRMLYLSDGDVLHVVGEYRLTNYPNDSLDIEAQPKTYSRRTSQAARKVRLNVKEAVNAL